MKLFTRYSSLILCIAVGALVALGLVMLTSTSAWVRGIEDPYFFLRKQAAMAVVGLVASIAAVIVPISWIRRWWPWMLAAICVLLALCYVPGIGVETYGSKRWVQVPGIGQFQPSELAKLIVVVSLAAWFARWQTEVGTFWKGFVFPGMIAGLPLVLIAGETDVGSALTLSTVVGAMLIAVGTRLRYIVPTALAAMSAAWFYVSHNPNRWSRIEAWLNLDDPVNQLGKGMQQWRALLALGNGGPWGVGLGNGVEKFGTLTFAHIDFIFPVVGEELGLPFTLGAVLCYVLIALCGCGIAVQATTLFERLLALGMTFVIVVPAIQNIAVVTGLLPNDGLPLPFVSYGGTSLVFSLSAVGLLVGIHRRSQTLSGTAEEFPLTKQSRGSLRL
ncbi:MAG: putative peptidoglycan glycosyltransferase FtsW [Luteolibacter sp.]